MATFNVPAGGPQERLTELWAVRELHQAGMEYLNIVVVGNIADAGGATEGYAAKTGPDLNTLLAERVIGDGFAGPGAEGFSDVIEIAVPMAYAGLGDLAVTGYATVGGSQDVALLALSAATLTPVSGTGNLFGDHAGGEERGTALNQIQAGGEPPRSGFYINGFTRSDPNLSGDPEDMYLIKTDSSGQTSCSVTWSPAYLSDEHGFCVSDPYVLDPGAVNETPSTTSDAPSWGSQICH
jgi:hypothetical protein